MVRRITEKKGPNRNTVVKSKKKKKNQLFHVTALSVAFPTTRRFLFGIEQKWELLTAKTHHIS